MPVSLTPFITLFVAILFFTISATALFGRRKRHFLLSFLLGLTLTVLPLLLTICAAMIHFAGASLGIPYSQFQLARTLDSGFDRWSAIALVPEVRFEELSWAYLDLAANNSYPEALYARGARLKRDVFLPVKVQASTERGQSDMDKAISLGYKPKVDPKLYHFYIFRHQPVLSY